MEYFDLSLNTDSLSKPGCTKAWHLTKTPLECSMNVIQFSTHSFTTRDKGISVARGIWVYGFSLRIYFSTDSQEELLTYCSDRHKINFEYISPNYQNTNNTFSTTYICGLISPKACHPSLGWICTENKGHSLKHFWLFNGVFRISCQACFADSFFCTRMPFRADSNKERCRKLWPLTHRGIFSVT